MRLAILFLITLCGCNAGCAELAAEGEGTGRPHTAGDYEGLLTETEGTSVVARHRARMTLYGNAIVVNGSCIVPLEVRDFDDTYVEWRVGEHATCLRDYVEWNFLSDRGLVLWEDGKLVVVLETDDNMGLYFLTAREE